MLYGRGCRHVQVDEPLLTHIAFTAGASEAINMVKRIARCFEVRLCHGQRGIAIEGRQPPIT